MQKKKEHVKRHHRNEVSKNADHEKPQDRLISLTERKKGHNL